MLEFIEVLQTRRSIRQYKSEAIPKELILKLLDNCRYAANAHNSQPYRYIILQNPSIKATLIKEMVKRYEQDLRADGISEAIIIEIISTSQNRFLNAPVLILACLTMENMHKYPDSERQKAEFIMGIQSVANSSQNLLLAAHAEGLGACWYCAPLFCPDIVKSTLNLPDSYSPLAFITLGIPNETPPPINRKPIGEIVQFL